MDVLVLRILPFAYRGPLVSSPPSYLASVSVASISFDPCSAVKLKSEILETALALDLEHHRIARLQFAER